MTLELLAAVLVGIAVMVVVLEPLFRPPMVTNPPILDVEEFEETPKGIALAALREIEFDRATGKLSDEDYAQLKGEYTERALTILRARDSAPLPSALADPAAAVGADLEAIIHARAQAIRQSGGAGFTCPRCGPRPETDALFCSSCGELLPGAQGCPSCGSPQTPDSRFCEECGTAFPR
jgi:hypothetical protein